MTIVQKLLHRVGGSLCVDSTPGTGTAFWITFNLPVSSHSAPREPIDAGCSDGDTAVRRLRVLVAEDNRINLVAIQKFLEHLDHEAVLVTDGAAALDILRRESFDCVLMDVQMPVMDGIEATRRIRNDMSGTLPKDIPIIAVTAHALAGDRETLLEEGMTSYMTKPISIRKLQAVLAVVAAGRD